MTESRTVERIASFPLRRKLGFFALGLFFLLVLVCSVGIQQLLSLQTDGRRLLEETRELALANDLEAHFDLIGLLLTSGQSSQEEDRREELLVLVQESRDLLGRVDRGPEGGEDPSRETHQENERELTKRIAQQLNVLEDRIHLSRKGSLHVDTAGIEALRSTGKELKAAATGETDLADANLRSSSGNAVRVMLVTVLLAVLGMLAMLLLVLRTVVRPIAALRLRAEALGRGEFEPGTPLENQDEIAQLAQTFDAMAQRVAANESALRARVATQTLELARAARYADLGVLAAGVAHEINNPLATIVTCAEGMQRRLDRGALERREETEYFRTIASEAYRARDITQRLLELARPDPAPATRVMVSTILSELQRVTKHQLRRKSVSLEIDSPPTLAVRGNSAELLRALVNLVLNARDACDAGACIRVSAAEEGGATRIDVDDEGPGIPPDMMDRIFEPFFTTKPQGEGTGLGLSLVASIVEGHGGSIVAMRAPSGGARFRIRIPLDRAEREKK